MTRKNRPPTAAADFSHDPVMLAEMRAAMAPQANEIYVDATFGAGGYTSALLADAPCRVIAFDRDPEAATRHMAMPAALRDRCTFVDAPFSDMGTQLQTLGVTGVNGVVMDLGVSSPQLDDAARGFSFRFSGPLDMRMDPRAGLSAADVVNDYDEKEIADILYLYGEERRARAIARAIIAARQDARIESTDALAAIIRRVVKTSPKDLIDPCTRSFQALRIFVNRELDELEAGLAAATRALKPQGRLVVVSFHSLEDRIVKQFLYRHAGRAGRPSRHLPEDTAAAPLYILHPARAQGPSAAECVRNPRARSAKMRVAIRTTAPADEGAFV